MTLPMSMQRALAPLLFILPLLHGCVTQRSSTVVPVETFVRYEPVHWSEVAGWQSDQTQEAWGAFMQSCAARNVPAALKPTCYAARSLTVSSSSSTQAREFFEVNFIPLRIVRIEGSKLATNTGLITGYYEPLLRGSREPSATYATALYAPPEDMLSVELSDVFPELKGKRVRGRLKGGKVVPYHDRAALRTHATLQGKELVWVDSALDAFFLEVQGSGRVQFADGSTIRLAYADQNGQPYRSIGRYLVDRGELALEESSAPAIRRWIEAHPSRLLEVLDSNPSMVFFREERIEDPMQGPRGTLGVPLTAGRSIAVDRRFIPLGAPVFLSTTLPASHAPLQRLVIAQDTGGAIRGPVRADLFWGFGAAAAEAAGFMKQQGQLWLLWPRDTDLPDPITSM